jgi:hypothetical protein
LSCSPICGDGIVVTGEQCDLGSTNDKCFGCLDC